MGKNRTVNAKINVTFEQATKREAIASGEALPTLMGKIKKYFADLSTVAFTGKYSDLTGAPAAYVHPTTAGNKHIPSGGSAGKYLKWSSDGTAVWADPVDTTYGTVSKTAAGLAPQLPNETGTTKYLRQDGTWAVPPDTNTTYGTVSKTSAGLAPQLPNETGTTKYLRQDGTWAVPPNTWQSCTKDREGYVPKGTGNADKVYRTDSSGNPAWREVADNNLKFSPDTEGTNYLVSLGKLNGVTNTVMPLNIVASQVKFEGDTGSPDVIIPNLYAKTIKPYTNSEYTMLDYPSDKYLRFPDPSGSDNLSCFTKLAKGYVQTHKLIGMENDLGYTTSGHQLSINNISINYGIAPANDNQINLGGPSARWKQVYAGTSAISTSDRNLKDNIASLDDAWISFFMKLQPKSFTFKDGNSGRTHIGFIAQDVEDVLAECGLTAMDFAGFCKDQRVERHEIEKVIPADEEKGTEEFTVRDFEYIPVVDDDGNPVYIYSLRYEEFIALNTMMIQKLYAKNQSIEERLAAIESALNLSTPS